jgi:hypothetical protein
VRCGSRSLFERVVRGRLSGSSAIFCAAATVPYEKYNILAQTMLSLIASGMLICEITIPHSLILQMGFEA